MWGCSGQVRLKKGKVLLPWDCDEKQKFLKGFPAHLVKKKTALDDLKFAIEEAEVRLVIQSVTDWRVCV